MAKVSVIIPARNERFLAQTVNDVLTKAAGDVECIVSLDGYWPDPQLADWDNLVIIHRGQARGMRPAINAAAAIAKGEYLMKCDAHCMFGEGFDEVLKASSNADWVIIPRRKRLDAENWCVQDVRKPDVDYNYLSYPDNPADFGGPGLNGRIWTQKALDRTDPKYDIDEELSFQGSCWFMPRDYFHELGLMDEKGYGIFWNEAQEISFKAWLSGGKVVRNKKTFYAHLHKGRKFGRGYHLSSAEVKKGATFTRKWLDNSAWDNRQIHPLSWLIERFWPLPTWPDNWKDVFPGIDKLPGR